MVLPVLLSTSFALLAVAIAICTKDGLCRLWWMSLDPPSTPSSSSNPFSRLFHPKSKPPSSLKYISASKQNQLSDNPFHRPPSAANSYATTNASESTFRTGHSASTTAAYPSSSSSSAASVVQQPPSPLMSSHDIDGDEGECPVCLEPLSFSFRLPGEKPHIVPECGHALHEVCTFSKPISASLARLAYLCFLHFALLGLFLCSLWSSSNS